MYCCTSFNFPLLKLNSQTYPVISMTVTIGWVDGFIVVVEVAYLVGCPIGLVGTVSSQPYLAIASLLLIW